MFAIPPDATVQLVVPTVTDADADAVAAAVPGATREHAYSVCVTLNSSMGFCPGFSGIPVFGVTPAWPMYRIWLPRLVSCRLDAALEFGVKIHVGTASRLTFGTVPSSLCCQCAGGQMTETTDAYPIESVDAPAP